MLKEQKCEIIWEEEGGNFSIYEENTMNEVLKDRELVTKDI